MTTIRDLLAFMRRANPGGDLDTDDVKDRVLKQEMMAARRRLARDWHVDGEVSRRRADIKRSIKKLVRKRYKPFGERPEPTLEHRVMLLRERRDSLILDSLFPDRQAVGGWKKLRERNPDADGVILNLNDFSFLDNPETAISSLKAIAEAEATAIEAKINFNDTNCLDVTPFMILMECWQHLLPIFQGGRMEPPMQKVLVALGIPQAMGIGVTDVKDLDDVWAFPLCRRRGAGSTQSKASFTDVQTREVANDEFCWSVDAWLNEVGMELTDRGIGWIKSILGELLENAERHSDGDRMDGTWAVSGCMVRRYDEGGEEWRFQVYLGILSLGDTFSASLDRASARTRQQVDDYVNNSQRRGAEQSRETLRTLAALQDTVTCVATADDHGRGGYGLQDMIELVSFLGGNTDSSRQPRVTIVSGRSCIQLKHPYILGARVGDDQSPRVLWCNDTNSKDQPPDSRYVYDLSTYLPGTAISIGFELDDKYFDQVVALGGNHANDKP